MVQAVANPPWVDRFLVNNWESIERRVGADWMPSPAPFVGKKAKFAEFGCGHYGCVLPSRQAGHVFKVTTDITEAALVSALLTIPENDRSQGIVSYDWIYQTDALHSKKPVFVLSREEAEDVGGWMDGRYFTSQRSETYAFRRASERVTNFKKYANEVRNRVLRSADRASFLRSMRNLGPVIEDEVSWADAADGFEVHGRLTGAHAAAFYLRAADIVSQEMAQEDKGYLVGDALHSLIDEGLLLADVHLMNIGHVERGWVITDPGHMVPLREKWFDVSVPSL